MELSDFRNELDEKLPERDRYSSKTRSITKFLPLIQMYEPLNGKKDFINEKLPPKESHVKILSTKI